MAYVFAVTANLSHLRITTPDSDYALPFIGLSIHAPAMNSGDEHFVFYSHGVLTVTVPVFESNLIGATWQLRLQDLETNYLYLGFGGGGGGTVMSVNGGTGIVITGPAANPIVNLANTAVVAGSYTNMSATVDAQGRLTAASSGTAPVTAVNVAAPITTTGGTTPTIGHAASGAVAGSYTSANITIDATGHVTAAANGGSGGTVTAVTATAPLASTGGATPDISHNTSGVVAATYTNSTVTVDATGHVTAASSGTAPVTAVNVAAPITTTGGTTPTIGHAASGVVAGAYTSANITVDASGHITAAANGAGGGISTVGALVKTGTADALSISGTAIRAHVGTSSTHGVGHIQTWGGASNVAIGEGCFSNYSTAPANGRNTGCGYNALGTSSTITTANDSAAFGSYALQSLTTGDNNTGIGSFALSAVTTGASNTACGSGAGAATNGSGNTLIGATAGSLLTAAAASNVAVGYDSMSAATNVSSSVAVGASTLRAQISGINTAVGFESGAGMTSGDANTMCGYRAGTALTSGARNTIVGHNAGASAVLSTNNVAVGYNALALCTGGENSAIGTAALSLVTAGTQNTAVGNNAGQSLTTGTKNICIGIAALGNCTTGSNNIAIGPSTSLAAATDVNSLVIGNGAIGAGSNTTAIHPSLIRAPGIAGTQVMRFNTATGEVIRDTSSLYYKDLLPGTPPVQQFAHRLLDLVPRYYKFKSDATNATQIGYIAEEVEDIRGPLGNPVFAGILNYTMRPDTNAEQIAVTKTRLVAVQPETPDDLVTYVNEEYQEMEYPKIRCVDGINYERFVIPLIALCKSQQEQIDSLLARVTALEATP